MSDSLKIETPIEGAEKDLIGLLDFEISRLEDEVRRPGWTQWALVGAFATCLWLLLAESESHANQIRIAFTLYLFLILLVTWDALIALKGILCFAFPPVGQKTKFWYTNKILAGARPPLFAKFVEKFCLLMIVWFCPLISSTWVRTMAIVVFCLTLVTISFAFVTTYRRSFIPIGRPRYPWLSVALKISDIVLVILLDVFFIKIAIKNASLFSVPEIRVSLLLFAISLIVPLLLSGKIHQPFLNTLLSLRRKLSLHDINYESAKKELNVFFEGMNFTEILRENVDTILGRYRDAHDASTLLVKEAAALIPSAVDSLQTEGAGLLRPLATQLKPRRATIERQLERAAEARADLENVILGLKWVALLDDVEIKKLLETVDSTISGTKTATQANLSEVEKLLSKV